jgi:hypothetical protein
MDMADNRQVIASHAERCHGLTGRYGESESGGIGAVVDVWSDGHHDVNCRMVRRDDSSPFNDYVCVYDIPTEDTNPDLKRCPNCMYTQNNIGGPQRTGRLG